LTEPIVVFLEIRSGMIHRAVSSDSDRTVLIVRDHDVESRNDAATPEDIEVGDMTDDDWQWTACQPYHDGLPF
jgi:hypothetical protein